MENTNIHRGVLNPENTYKLPETVAVELGGKEYPCREFVQTKNSAVFPFLISTLCLTRKNGNLPTDRQKKLHPEMYAEYYAGLKKG